MIRLPNVLRARGTSEFSDMRKALQTGGMARTPAS
jgi:hypothetical protein